MGGGGRGWLLLFPFFCFLKEVELAGAGPNSVFFYLVFNVDKSDIF